MRSKHSPTLALPQWRHPLRAVMKNTIPLLLPKPMRQPVRAKLWRHVPQRVATPPTTNTILEIKNKGCGRRCFIVGTAPSLIQLELSKIQKDFIFLVNSAYRIAHAFGKKPDALMFTNPTAFREQVEKIRRDDFDYFFVSSEAAAPNKVRGRTQIVFEQWEKPHIYDGFFQFDCSRPLYHAHTVVLSAVQMAVWMGFYEIYIIGVDLDFFGNDPHFYESSSGEIKRARSTSIRNQEKMLAGFAYAQRALLSETNVEMYNAGVGGNLNCISRVDFNSLF